MARRKKIGKIALKDQLLGMLADTKDMEEALGVEAKAEPSTDTGSENAVAKAVSAKKQSAPPNRKKIIIPDPETPVLKPLKAASPSPTIEEKQASAVKITTSDNVETLPPVFPKLSNVVTAPPKSPTKNEKRTSEKDSVSSEPLAEVSKNSKKAQWDSDPVTHRPSGEPSDPVTQWPSGGPSDPVTQWPSDPTTGTVTQRPSGPQTQWDSDPVTQRDSDPVTHRPSDPVGAEKMFQIPPVDWNRKPDDLKANQFEILHHVYFNRPFKIRGANRILPHIAESTVRNSLRKSLINKCYILDLFGINDGVNVGSTCLVDEAICLSLFGPSPIMNSEQEKLRKSSPVTQRPSGIVTQRPSDPATQRPSGIVTQRDSDPVSSSYSSSSFLNKATTPAGTSNPDIETAITAALESPDLNFWKLKDLRAPKVVRWMREYQVSLQDMIDSLTHCAFYLRTAGEKDAKKQPIKCAASWFKSRIQKERYYDAPTGFETEAGRRLRREKDRIAKQKAEIEALRKARAEREKLQMDLAFEQMLANPEGKLYRQCEVRLSNFERQRARKTPVAMEKALRRAFEAQMKEVSDGELPE